MTRGTPQTSPLLPSLPLPSPPLPSPSLPFPPLPSPSPPLPSLPSLPLVTQQIHSPFQPKQSPSVNKLGNEIMFCTLYKCIIVVVHCVRRY